MQSRSPVELADQVSRRRAIAVAIAAAVFLIIQIVTRPVFNSEPETARHLSRAIMWAVNAAALLLLLFTGGGLMQRKEIRVLVNDEVTRAHSRSAIVIGYWSSMIIAMGLYAIAGDGYTAREAIYLIVTPSVCLALFVFSWLELRAHRDA
jgi:hypothetical protein